MVFDVAEHQIAFIPEENKTKIKDRIVRDTRILFETEEEKQERKRQEHNKR